MDNSFVEYNQVNGVGTVQINRPNKRNALNTKIFNELKNTFQKIENSEDLKVVILTGIDSNEMQIFSSGIDLIELAGLAENKEFDELEDEIKSIQDSVSTISYCSKPVIALIKGPCLGSGYELALACDFRIANEAAQIGLLETKFGIIPDLGGTTRLVKLVGQQIARKVIMLADKYDGKEAKELGLVDWVFPDNLIDENLDNLIKKIKNNSSDALSAVKSVISQVDNLNPEIGLELERNTQLELIQSKEFKMRINEYLKSLK